MAVIPPLGTLEVEPFDDAQPSKSWENAMNRLAAFSKCGVYIRSTVDSLRAAPGTMDTFERSIFHVGLGFALRGLTVEPIGIKLSYDASMSCSPADAGQIVLLWRSNFGKQWSVARGRTVESACRTYLTMNAGETMGVSDTKPILVQDSTGYQQEIFHPVVRIPEFQSLDELSLKLTAMGA